MRINLTKKDLVNLVYMQLGFSKQISENLIDDFLHTIVDNFTKGKSLKLSKFGTFIIRKKKSRVGRNPKTKKETLISERNVVLFKPSKEFKDFVNSKILTGNRRYYDEVNIILLKKIKYLLKDQGMTIIGVKKLLNSANSNNLDEISNKTIRTDNVRDKIKIISKKIKDLKNIK